LKKLITCLCMIIILLVHSNVFAASNAQLPLNTSNQEQQKKPSIEDVYERLIEVKDASHADLIEAQKLLLESKNDKLNAWSLVFTVVLGLAAIVATFITSWYNLDLKKKGEAIRKQQDDAQKLYEDLKKREQVLKEQEKKIQEIIKSDVFTSRILELETHLQRVENNTGEVLRVSAELLRARHYPFLSGFFIVSEDRKISGIMTSDELEIYEQAKEKFYQDYDELHFDDVKELVDEVSQLKEKYLTDFHFIA